jgi:hypothetical protein
MQILKAVYLNKPVGQDANSHVLLSKYPKYPEEHWKTHFLTKGSAKVKGSEGHKVKQDLVRLSAKNPGEQAVTQTLFSINSVYLHFPLQA